MRSIHIRQLKQWLVSGGFWEEGRQTASSCLWDALSGYFYDGPATLLCIDFQPEVSQLTSQGKLPLWTKLQKRLGSLANCFSSKGKFVVW